MFYRQSKYYRNRLKEFFVEASLKKLRAPCSVSRTRPGSSNLPRKLADHGIESDLDWRDSDPPAPERTAGTGCLRSDRISGDARWPGQDSPPEGARRNLSESGENAGASCQDGGAWDRADRHGRRQPYTLFGRRSTKPGVELEEAIENIDIGGPAMIRSASKNHHDVAVVVDPADYQRVWRGTLT
jgi:hypothetical protein